MKKYKKIECEAITDIICDICGNSCYIIMKELDNIKDFYGTTLKYISGYYSKYFEDDVIIEIDLCEKCISKLYDKKLKNKKEE